MTTAWQLNPSHSGVLQGLTEKEAYEMYGEEKVTWIWVNIAVEGRNSCWFCKFFPALVFVEVYVYFLNNLGVVLFFCFWLERLRRKGWNCSFFLLKCKGGEDEASHRGIYDNDVSFFGRLRSLIFLVQKTSLLIYALSSAHQLDLRCKQLLRWSTGGVARPGWKMDQSYMLNTGLGIFERINTCWNQEQHGGFPQTS